MTDTTQTVVTRQIKFHPNPTQDWETVKNAGSGSVTLELMDSNGGVHNPACKIDSKSCSSSMSPDVTDLCEWHRLRMARHVTMQCGCGPVDTCWGDSPGRWMFRNYYDCWEIPVVDTMNKFYCCGHCQSTDTETHQCGTSMLVGECCLDKHPNATKIIRATDADYY